MNAAKSQAPFMVPRTHGWRKLNWNWNLTSQLIRLQCTGPWLVTLSGFESDLMFPQIKQEILSPSASSLVLLLLFFCWLWLVLLGIRSIRKEQASDLSTHLLMVLTDQLIQLIQFIQIIHMIQLIQFIQFIQMISSFKNKKMWRDECERWSFKRCLFCCPSCLQHTHTSSHTQDKILQWWDRSILLYYIILLHGSVEYLILIGQQWQSEVCYPWITTCKSW